MQVLPIVLESEEARVKEILEAVRTEDVQRRIMLYPFFKDFEKV